MLVSYSRETALAHSFFFKHKPFKTVFKRYSECQLENSKNGKSESKRCSLCLCEKFEIANYPENNLLNKRTEIISKCRHTDGNSNFYSTILTEKHDVNIEETV